MALATARRLGTASTPMMVVAPDSFAPAMMQAWESASTRMRSPSPTKVGMIPVLAR